MGAQSRVALASVTSWCRACSTENTRTRLRVSREGRTRYSQSEVFHGVLVPLTGGLLAATQQGFEAMNTALKARAEMLAKAAASGGGRETG